MRNRSLAADAPPIACRHSGSPLLLLVAEHVAMLNSEHRPEVEAKLADPGPQGVANTLTAVIGLTFAIDGAS